jgi:hypothetical protein
MAQCKKPHRYADVFDDLPEDQGGGGRHKCAGCAYERGLEEGRKRNESPELDLDSLPESQAGTVRHRSPHAAWAKGYQDGVAESYT